VLWLHSKNPQFRQKVNDIVGLYHADLPEDVALICIDEKSGMQANEKLYETQLPESRKRGRVEFEYIRHCMQTLISAFNVKTGAITALCGDSRKADDLVQFMGILAEQYCTCRKIIIILLHGSTRSILTKRLLRHGSFVSKADLKHKVMAFIKRWNHEEGHPFQWKFSGYALPDQEVA
jgi:hypothetical protein